MSSSTPASSRLGLRWAFAAFTLIPLLLGGLILFKTLEFSLVWDDELLLTHPLRGPATLSWATALRDSLSGFMINPELYWRPLGTLSFWWPTTQCQTMDCVIQYAHAINYGLYLAHLLATLFLVNIMLAKRQTLNSTPLRAGPIAFCCLMGAAAAGLHPANAEIFVWISGRFDALLSLFLTFALAFVWLDRGPLFLRLCGVFVCLCLAQLSKDGAQIGALLIAALSFASEKSLKEKMSVAGTVVLSLTVISLTRIAWADSVSAADFVIKLDWATLVNRYVSASGQAFLSLAQPWLGVSPAHPIILGTKEILSSVIFHLVALISACQAFQAWRSKRARLLAWTLCLSVCALVLISCVVNSALNLNQDFIWADRYLAPAWPFFAAAVSLGLYELIEAASPKRIAALRAPGVLVSLAVVIASAMALNQEASFWKTNVVFWNRVVQEDPENIKSITNFTLALHKAGRLDLAEREAERGLAIMEKNKSGFYEMVRLASATKMALGKNEEAKEIIQHWLRTGHDSFHLRFQEAILNYQDNNCLTGNNARLRARELAKTQPHYRTSRELIFLDTLAKTCE